MTPRALYSFRVSPDGTRALVFIGRERADSRWDIGIVPLDVEMNWIVGGKDDERAPDLSPDNRWSVSSQAEATRLGHPTVLSGAAEVQSGPTTQRSHRTLGLPCDQIMVNLRRRMRQPSA